MDPIANTAPISSARAKACKAKAQETQQAEEKGQAPHQAETEGCEAEGQETQQAEGRQNCCAFGTSGHAAVQGRKSQAGRQGEENRTYGYQSCVGCHFENPIAGPADRDKRRGP